MHPLGDAMQHLQLMARMGKHLGTDLAEAFEAGKISAEDWAEMITSCRGCDAPESCKRWLETQDGAAGAGGSVEPPDYCCNAARLLRLRAGSN
ncbi:DUF6455 family protein [Pseudophaeobacter arcticus]|jgi:hypothetical protein|uniref:DUF6455 family protein n=1 Tax=Pseudophaeobacter arcticus TaxID=385492 RepID=UPI000409E0FD|nr:DUF6455 family protein [Pseudophaeobacter arcticus]